MTAPPDPQTSARAHPADPLLGFLRGLGRRLAGWPRWVGALLTVAWALLIWASSSQPSGSVPAFPGMAFVANLAHAPLFGLLAFWATLCLPRSSDPEGDAGNWPRLDRRTLPWLVGAVFLWAVIDEWHQASVPGRQPSALDLVTDLVGATATLVVIRWLGRSGADAPGLLARLGVGLVACCAAAALSTWA